MIQGEPTHTLVMSDIHLSDAEPEDAVRPLWKRYKRRDLFVDAEIVALWRWAVHRAQGPLELVLNGDVFDFDSVMTLPPDGAMKVGWLERSRGLVAQEAKSLFKMEVILDDHPVFVEGLREVLAAGHRVVFVIGNHDMELHWPAVQRALLDRLAPAQEVRQRVRICDWFYISQGDTLIEHGNQYDSYCLCNDPVWPFIRFSPDDVRVRLPFGNFAGRYLTNGMGLFNPHVEDTFIMSLVEYLVFFYRYVIRAQPLLAWDWLWGATVTLWVSVRDGLMPAVRDPLTLDDRVEEVARRANATPRMVRSLRAISVHPAIFDPVKIARELWLDRVVLLLLVFFGTFQLFASLNLFVFLPSWWLLVFLAFVLPPYVFYARSINSDIDNTQRAIRRRIGLSSLIVGVDRVVLGHTHLEENRAIDGVQVYNPGSWSPAFKDPECTQPYGRKCFVWLRPEGEGREAALFEWTAAGPVGIEESPAWEGPGRRTLRRTVRKVAEGGQRTGKGGAP